MRRRSPASTSTRVLRDGTPLQNRLLASLPAADYTPIAGFLRLRSTAVGDTLHEHGTRIDDVFFPNGGVYSVTNRMRDGALVEVATVGREGMLGVGVFLGDRSGSGQTLQQVPDRRVVALAVAPFLKATAGDGVFRKTVARYAQATLSADHAVHRVQRAARRVPALLPLAAANTRSRRRERLCAQAGVPGDDARRSASHRDGGASRAPGDRTDRQSLWPHANPQAPAAGSGVLRMLRDDSRPLCATAALKARRDSRRRPAVTRRGV